MNSFSKTFSHLSNENRGGLPPWTYFSPELLEVEKSELFRKTWQCVGHVSDMPNAGDYLTLDIVGERAIIVRGKDGIVRAFHNVCRHRGSRVVTDQRGSCKSAIVCPFHGWSYNLDGTLRAVPLAKTFPQLDPQQHGLPPLEFEIWNGLVFVRFIKGPQPSVKTLMANFSDEIAHYRLGEVQPLRPICTDTLDANWKSVRDVDNEGYHVPKAHPALQDLYGGQYIDQRLGFGVSRSEGIMNDAVGKLWSVRNYKKMLPKIEHLPASNQRSWVYYGLYPNLVIMLYPDSIGFYQEFPLAVNKTMQRFAYYALPDDSREMKLTRYLSSRIDRDTGREDAKLIVWSCEAMKSSGFKDIILSDSEFGVREYHDFLRAVVPVVELREEPAQGNLASLNHSMSTGMPAVNWS